MSLFEKITSVQVPKSGLFKSVGHKSSEKQEPRASPVLTVATLGEGTSRHTVPLEPYTAGTLYGIKYLTNIYKIGSHLILMEQTDVCGEAKRCRGA